MFPEAEGEALEGEIRPRLGVGQQPRGQGVVATVGVPLVDQHLGTPATGSVRNSRDRQPVSVGRDRQRLDLRERFRKGLLEGEEGGPALGMAGQLKQLRLELAGVGQGPTGGGDEPQGLALHRGQEPDRLVAAVALTIGKLPQAGDSHRFARHTLDAIGLQPGLRAGTQHQVSRRGGREIGDLHVVREHAEVLERAGGGFARLGQIAAGLTQAPAMNGRAMQAEQLAAPAHSPRVRRRGTDLTRVVEHVRRQDCLLEGPLSGGLPETLLDEVPLDPLAEGGDPARGGEVDRRELLARLGQRGPLHGLAGQFRALQRPPVQRLGGSRRVKIGQPQLLEEGFNPRLGESFFAELHQLPSVGREVEFRDRPFAQVG